jgi:hypothetical protein
MLSESARMSSAAELAFRIQAPNSLPRSVKVVALDAPAEAAVKRLATAGWTHTTFLTASAFSGASRADQRFSIDGWLTDLAGVTKHLVNEIDTADLVVMVASPGGHAEVASIIGEVCNLKKVMTTALIVGVSKASDEELSKTLSQLRPWSQMVVIADAEQYIDDMLVALRA